MSRATRRAAASAGAAVAAVALSATSAVAAPPPAAFVGPSTTVEPYVLPVADGVSITSLLTVGDRTAGNGYRMVGIPDGLGALRTRGGYELLMNHELRPDAGVVRDHGQTGAFVSRLTVDGRTGEVVRGDDLIKTVRYWQYPAGVYGAAPVAPAGAAAGTHQPQFSRFCSGALTAPGQLLNKKTGNGYDGQLYFANEESGDEGRAFAVELDGTAHQLPRLGLFSWENTLAAANASDTTLVMGNEDAASGQLWVYKGTKTRDGSAVDKAGLTNGTNYVIDALDEAVSTDAQFRATYKKGQPAPVDLAEVGWDQSGAAQNAEGLAKGITLNRVEDGSFDPDNPNDYYFLTTEGGGTAPDPAVGSARDGGGLWRLSFKDIEKPELGGTLTLLLDGTEAPFLNKPDNMTIDEHGNLLIQEDPGGNDSVARILAYRIKDGARGVVAQFDPALFGASIPTGTTPATRAVITTDEESSGILDVSRVTGKKGTFVFDAQVHKARPATDPNAKEEVEEGQLLSMTVRSWQDVYTIEG